MKDRSEAEVLSDYTSQNKMVKPLGRPKILKLAPTEIPPRHILEDLPVGITFFGDKNGQPFSKEKI